MDATSTPGGSLLDATAPLDRERIFRGELLVFCQLPAMLSLVARGRALAAAAFAPHPPPTAQAALTPAVFLDRAAELRRAVMRDREASAALRALIAELGLDLDATYFDRLILRLQPSGTSHTGRRVRDLPPHRDSWGSNLMAQVNCWGPVYPVEAGATMVIWPRLFAQPVPNGSAEWSLERLREAPARYPLLPEFRGTLDGVQAVPILIEPGDLLCFSGAHLHASHPNRTGRVRLSLDTRFVHLQDLRNARGAPNVDGHAPHVATDWFHRLSDGAELPEHRRVELHADPEAVRTDQVVDQPTHVKSGLRSASRSSRT